MAIIVETGAIVSGANSYVSEAELTAFASARGITLVGDEEELLIKAMDYIESLGFKGVKFTQLQPLQWPRANVYIDGYYFSTVSIPNELKNGLMHCAIAIDESNDPLQDAPRKTRRERVGELEVEYEPGSSSVVINKKVMNALYKLLGSSTGGNVIDVRKA